MADYWPTETGGITPAGGGGLPPVGTGGNTPWTASAAGQIPQSTPGAAGYGSDVNALVNANAAGYTFGQDTQREIADAQVKYYEAQVLKAQQDVVSARNADELNRATLEFQKWKAALDDATKRQQIYSDTATALLNGAVQYAAKPADYFQFNQYTSGGRGIFDQLRGSAPRPDFSAPTGAITPGNIAALLERMGITAPGAGGATGGGAAAATPAAAQPSQVSQAQADAVASGLGVDRRYVYAYVQELGALPNSLQDFQAFLEGKGWRDPHTGALKPGGAEWGGAGTAAASAPAAAVGGGTRAAVAAPAAPVVAPRPAAAFSLPDPLHNPDDPSRPLLPGQTTQTTFGVSNGPIGKSWWDDAAHNAGDRQASGMND